MTVIDFIIIIALLFFFLLGLFKGFLLEFFGLLALTAGLFSAVKFGPMASGYFENIFPEGPTRNAAGFASVYLAAWLVVKIMGWILNKNLGEAETKPLSRLAGGVLGFSKCFLIMAMAIFIAENAFPGNKFTAPNKLTPAFIKTALLIQEHTPLKLPKRLDLQKKLLDKEKTQENILDKLDKKELEKKLKQDLDLLKE
ncbi:MAG TPA: CvpA family protein [archaeon]|nr:CvpA family protein [archaeon]